MRSNGSGCLTAIVSSFSRIMLLCAWIARPAMMNAAFSSFIVPCLGFMFLPFTTLMYVILVQGVGKIEGVDWLWLGIAVVLDLASIAGAGAANRNRIPAGVPGSYAEKELAAPSPAQPSAVTPLTPAAPPPSSAAPAAPTESKDVGSMNLSEFFSAIATLSGLLFVVGSMLGTGLSLTSPSSACPSLSPCRCRSSRSIRWTSPSRRS